MEDQIAGPSRHRGRRATQQGEFTIARAQAAEVGTAEHGPDTRGRQPVDPGKTGAEAQHDLDLPPYPARVAAKYYVLPGPDERAAERRAFADERGDYLVFRDEGLRLATRREEAAVVRDLVTIAHHREWSAIHVAGSTAFRRKVWLEATEREIAVTGYEPTDLDRQAAGKRQAEGRSVPDRLTQSLSGTYDRSARFPMSIDRAGAGVQRGSEARTLEGSGGRERRKDANPAAALRRRRANEDRAVDFGPASGHSFPSRGEEGSPGRQAATSTRLLGDLTMGEAREPAHTRSPGTRQDRWKAEYDRLQAQPGAATTRDRNLVDAQSHLVVLDRVLTQAFPGNSAARQAVLDIARDRLAQHLAAGRTLKRAEYTLPQRSTGGERDGPRVPRGREMEQSGPRRRSVREKER